MSGHIQQLQNIAQQAQSNFGGLTSAQLNWKPSADKWSIAQCLDHLVVADNTYNAKFNKIIAGTYKPSLWTRISPFSKYFGNFLKNNATAVVKKKMKRPEVFKPSSSQIDAGIVQRFTAHITALIEYFKKLADPELQKIKIPSPISGLVTYSIGDTLEILTGHELRHYNQAMNVLQHAEFPKQ